MSNVIKSGKYNWPKAVNMDKGPYFFVSYCHRNSVLVCHDLSILASYEVPFWYDDGMIPGQDWKLRAQQAMSHPNCIGVLFIITNASLQSYPVFEELKMALKLNGEREDFHVYSLHVGGKSVSKLAAEGRIPQTFLPLYSQMFPDNNIFIARKTAVISTEHIPDLLEIYNTHKLLKGKFRHALERSAFEVKPYGDNYLISGYRGNSSQIILPDKLNGKRIVAIGPSAFRNNTTLRSVKLESGIAEIFDNAFDGCTKLKTVELSGNLRYLGYECFKRCISLAEVSLPDGVTTLGDYAFYECSFLKAVYFNNAPVSIGYAAFSQCIALRDLRLSPNTRSIGNYAFGGCAMHKVDIFPSVESLGTDFCVCNPNLQMVLFHGVTLPSLPHSVVNLCPQFRCLSVPFAMEEQQFQTLAAVETTRRRLLDVTGFANNASGFVWNKVVGADEYIVTVDDKQFTTTETHLPYNIRKNSYRISFCAKSNRADVDESRVFFDYRVKAAVVENCVLRGGNFNGGKVRTERDVIAVADNAFCGNLSVTELNFCGNSIGSNAFANCINLTSVNLQSKVTLGSSAFAHCTKLNSVSWQGVVQLGSECFEECSGLTSICLAREVEILPPKCFRRCINLTLLTFEGEPKQLQTECLRGCMSLFYLDLPDSIEYIGERALSYLSLRKIKLPARLKYFDKTNLQSCSYLEEISIKGNNEFCISQYALVKDDCEVVRFPPAKHVDEIMLPPNIKIVQQGAYQDSSYLQRVEAFGVEKIEDYAFFASASLQTVVLPPTLRFVGANAFAHCENLQTVVLHGDNPLQIGHNAFGNNGVRIIVSSRRAQALEGNIWQQYKKQIEVQDV